MFSRIRSAVLKVNAIRCSFGLKEIPCLGYVIPRKLNKPDPNQLQGIIYIGRPTSTTEV